MPGKMHRQTLNLLAWWLISAARGAPVSSLSPHPSSKTTGQTSNHAEWLIGGARYSSRAMGPPESFKYVGVKSSHFVTVNKIFNLTEKRKRSMIPVENLKNYFH
jgi:hypothetical protein